MIPWRPLLALFAASTLATGVYAAAQHDPDTIEVHAAVERHHDRLDDVRLYAAGVLDAQENPYTTTTTQAKRRVHAAHVTPAPTAVGAVPDLIRAGFARFGPTVVAQALRVASCESTGDPTGSRFNPNATGSQGEVGLFQLHPRYHTGRAAKFGWSMADLYDPAKNVDVAVDLYAEQGWGPWSCRWAA